MSKTTALRLFVCLLLEEGRYSYPIIQVCEGDDEPTWTGDETIVAFEKVTFGPSIPRAQGILAFLYMIGMMGSELLYSTMLKAEGESLRYVIRSHVDWDSAVEDPDDRLNKEELRAYNRSVGGQLAAMLECTRLVMLNLTRD